MTPVNKGICFVDNLIDRCPDSMQVHLWFANGCWATVKSFGGIDGILRVRPPPQEKMVDLDIKQ